MYLKTQKFLYCGFLLFLFSCPPSLATNCKTDCTESPAGNYCFGTSTCWCVDSAGNGFPSDFTNAWCFGSAGDCQKSNSCLATSGYNAACAADVSPSVNTGCAYVQMTNGVIAGYWSDIGCTTTSCSGAPEMDSPENIWGTMKKVYQEIKRKFFESNKS